MWNAPCMENLFDRPEFLMNTQNRKTVILLFDHKNEENFVRTSRRMKRLHHIGRINDHFFYQRTIEISHQLVAELNAKPFGIRVATLCSYKNVDTSCKIFQAHQKFLHRGKIGPTAV